MRPTARPSPDPDIVIREVKVVDLSSQAGSGIIRLCQMMHKMKMLSQLVTDGQTD